MKNFDSFGQFARHLLKTAALGPVVMEHAAKAAAKVVQHDAQARIGEYQDGIGPYPAWANLAEATVNDRLAKGFTPDDPLLRTGELRDSIEVVSEGSTAGVVTADQVALWQEMGTNKIPPRPFLGPAAVAAGQKASAAAAAVAVRWVAGSPVNRLLIPLDAAENAGQKN